MKKIISSILYLLILILHVNTLQVRSDDKYISIYKIQSHNNQKKNFHLWDGKYLYKSQYPDTNSILYSWDGKYIYRERTNKIVGVWDGQYLYKGESAIEKNIVYCWDGEYIYKGKDKIESKIAFSWDGRRLFRGKYKYYMYTIEGVLPTPVLMVLGG